MRLNLIGTILVVGDVMLDRYIDGFVERISPEAPVPVLIYKGEREIAGGAANVAVNIARLGGHAQLIGVVGNDRPGERLYSILRELGVESDLICDPGRPTVSKIRVMADKHQFVRIDQEVIVEQSRRIEEEIVACITKRLVGAKALILSDYAKGTLTDRVLEQAIALARVAGVPVLVDPKRKTFDAYIGAAYIKPNRSELTLATGISCNDYEGALAAARGAAAATGANILLTRSEQGMLLVQQDGEVTDRQTDAKEIFDVSGAGDTVMATFSLALASGLIPSQAMRLANVAAGIVISKVGTATVTPAEITTVLNAQEYDEIACRGALVSWEDARRLREIWSYDGHRVGFTNGCFDLLHPGHIAVLRGAAGHCDRLIVALNSDISVKRLKGPSRPVQDQLSRAEIIGALACVDAVVLFDEDTPQKIIEYLAPDVLVKGADYEEAEIVGGEVVKGTGGRVERIEIRAGHSTSGLIARSRHR
jgi:D-beta-D-heptose 7-phosphate kinase / D-beta-D-heptose 1-phosphate adenosyltransferase